jgi:glycosyltransferase involved in cell wall biosynthesis
MRIGIDARFLTHPQVGGFKTYTENLVNALGQVDSANHYVIYVDRPLPPEGLPQPENFTYVVVDGTLPIVGMPVREQIRLKQRMANDHLDLIHFLCNTAPVGVPGKFVVTLHDTIQVKSAQPFKLVQGLAGYKHWAMTAYSKWAILKTVQAAQRIITVSNYEKTQIAEQLDIAPERVCVTHLAPNPVFALARPEVSAVWRKELPQKFGVQKKFVLGVGYEPRKNIPLLIEMFSQLAPALPDLDLVIVAAESTWRLVFAEMAAQRGLSERINILKAVTPNELAMLLNLAEVFVYPSERESFGLPPLEALACGAPTIAMNMTSLPEILEDGAILIDGKDVQTWANGIRQVVVDDSLRQDLARRGLQQAAKLTWQRCARDTIEVYRTVAAESRGESLLSHKMDSACGTATRNENGAGSGFTHRTHHTH